jgi:hypothetical protein
VLRESANWIGHPFAFGLSLAGERTQKFRTGKARSIVRAVRFAGIGHPPQIADIAKPMPGPGQILIKIGGAGVCHSNLHIMEEDLGFDGGFTRPRKSRWIRHEHAVAQSSDLPAHPLRFRLQPKDPSVMFVLL